MYTISIDETGHIDNPCLVDRPGMVFQKAWGALVFRSGRKIKIASFLPRESQGEKFRVRDMPRGVYLKFCSTTERGETCSLYVADQVTENEISLRSIADTDVPSTYDIDSMAPTKAYILEAKLAMLEAQMDDLRASISDLKRTTS